MHRPIFAILVLAGFTTSSEAALLAYYSFDSNFTDGSGNANNLTAGAGTPTITTTTGQYKFGGGALDLDKTANEYLNLATTISFGTSDAWSVSFWAQRRPLAAAATGMVMGDNTTTDSFIWLTDNPAQVQGLRFRPVGVGTTNNNDYTTGHDTSFHHWVVVADGTGTIRVYRDNVDLGTRLPSGGADFDITTIGSGYTGTTQIFDGQLDEIYIFNEVIGATTVNQLFTNVPEPGSLALLGVGGLMMLRRRRCAG